MKLLTREECPWCGAGTVAKKSIPDSWHAFGITEERHYACGYVTRAKGLSNGIMSGGIKEHKKCKTVESE